MVTIPVPTAIQFAKDLLPDVRIEPTARRIRAVINGQAIVDTIDAFVLFERDHLPAYYFPRTSLRAELLVDSDLHTFCPRKGTASYFHVEVGDRLVENAVWYYPEPLEQLPELAGLVSFYWDRVDHWFEEDEEVFKHARDPYHRVDALRSSRHVQIVVNSEVVADTTRPVLLFETGLPTRYYIPREDVRTDLLTANETASVCPYKGTASYWSLTVGDRTISDAVWSYAEPVPQAPTIKGLLCFFDERIDDVIVDGVTQPKPTTPWS
ncbi:MAG: hypothetical protein JWN39_127 [Ilumatobacteraceae bacterium]|nr:hypothetical protein [Ilumatobacteraceae bacterium]